jgi:hypothetical protein
MLFIRIKQNNSLWFERWLEGGETGLIVPLFENEKYDIEIYSKNGELIKKESFIANKSGITIIIPKGKIETTFFDKKDIEVFIQQLIKNKFDEELQAQFNLIKSMYPHFKINEGQIRGGRLEQLVWLYLKKLKSEKIIDDVIWSGKIGEHGLPYPASGKPDLLICIDNLIVVLELTVIPDTRKQWSAEGVSVPDHIRIIFEDNPQKKIIGIFSAPSIHKPLAKNLKSYSKEEGIPIICLSIDELLNLLALSSKGKIINILKNIHVER